MKTLRQWMPLAAVVAFLICTASTAYSAGTFYSYTDSTYTDVTRKTKTWVPDSLTTVRGILLNGNGAGGDSTVDASDLHKQAFCEKQGFILLATGYFGRFSDGIGGNDWNVLMNAIADVATRSGHAEVTNAPFVNYGFSNGGQMAYDLALLIPDRTVAFCANKGGYYITTSVGPVNVPGIFIAGEADSDLRRSAISNIYVTGRSQGAPWAWLEEENVGHAEGNSEALLFAFYEEVLSQRYPTNLYPTATTQPVLLPVVETNGWLVSSSVTEWQSGFSTIQPSAGYAGDKTQLGWVPSEKIAQLYRANASFDRSVSVVFSSYLKPMVTQMPGDPLSGAPGTLYYPNRPVHYALDIAPTIAGWQKVEFFDGTSKLGEALNEGTNTVSADLILDASLKNNSLHSILTLSNGTKRTSSINMLQADPLRTPDIPSALSASAATNGVGTPVDSQTFTWGLPTNKTSVLGYSYAINAEPDEVSEGTGTSSAYTNLNDGTYIFKVRAQTSDSLTGRTVWGPSASFDLEIISVATAEISTNAITVLEGSSSTFDVYMSGPTMDSLTLTVAQVSGDTDLSVSSGAQLIFTAGTWTTPQTVTISAAQDGDSSAGSAVFSVTGFGTTPAYVTATESDDDVGISISTNQVVVPEGGTAAFGMALNALPSAPVTVNVVRVSGDTDISVSGTSVFVFNSGNWNVEQTVTLAAAEDTDGSAGSATIECSSDAAVSAQLTATEADNDFVTVASGLIAAWNLESLSGVVSSSNAYLMATGLVQSVLTHSNTNEIRTSTRAMKAIDNDETTIAAAITAGNYFYWQIEPEAGYLVTITSVVVRTDIDDNDTTFTFLLSDASGINDSSVLAQNTSGGPQASSVDLSGQAEFQNSSDPIEFRVYGYRDNGPYTAMYIGQAYDANNVDDIQIYGTVVLTGDVGAAPELSIASVGVPEGGSAQYNVRLTQDPSTTVTVLTSFVIGDTDISITGGSALYFDSTTWSNWQTVTLSAVEDSDFLNGEASFRSIIDGTASFSIITAVEIENDTTFEFSSATINVPEGSTTQIQVRPTAYPGTDVSATVTKTTGDADITLTSGSSLTFTAANWTNWQTIVLSAAEDADAETGSALFTVSAAGINSAWIQATEAENESVFTDGLVGPPRRNWRIAALDATASENGATVAAALTAGTNGTFASSSSNGWLAVKVPAISDPALLTFEVNKLIAASAQQSYNSTDGQDGDWVDLPLQIYQPNATVSRLQKVDIDYGPARWIKLSITSSNSTSFTASSLGLYQIDPDGWNDYWVILGASIQDMSIRNMTFKGIVQTNYGFDPIVFNVAISGYYSAGTLDRLPADLARHPYSRYIGIHTGGNDVSAYRPYPGGANTLSNNLVSILNMIVASNRVPILSRLSFRAYPTAPVVDTVNDPASEANGSGPYVDAIYDPLISLYCTNFFDQATGKGTVNAYDYFKEHQNELNADGIHPNATGQYSWNVLWAVDAGASIYDTNYTPPLVTSISASTNTLSIAEGGSGNIGVALSSAPTQTVTVTVSRISGSTNLSVSSGSSLIFTTNDWSQSQTMTITAAQDADFADDTATFRLSGNGLSSTDITAVSNDDDQPTGGTHVNRWLFDLGGTTYLTAGNWNQITSAYSTGIVLDGAIDTNGLSSSMQVNVLSAFSGVNTSGVADGSVYPINAQRDSFYITGSGTTGTQLTQSVIRVQGLDTSLVYNVTFFGSRSAVSDGRITRYTIGSDIAYLNSDNNTSTTVSISNVTASAGYFDIQMAPYNESDVLSQYAYIGIIDIEAVTASSAPGVVDSDSDGIPDTWETQYFGNSTNANPGDLAANGINTILQAYIAGLDPLSASERLTLSGLQPLSWSAVSGRVYTVYWTSNLLSNFQILGTNLTGGAFTDLVHGASSEGFYRIEVQLAP